MIDIITHTFAAAYLIYLGCIFKVIWNRISFLYLFIYLITKVAPILVGLLFAFNLYAKLMGWQP
jgi:hypothetical protein